MAISPLKLPLQFDQNTWYTVPGKINNHPVKFMVDTGAGGVDCIIEKSLAQKLKLDPSKEISIRGNESVNTGVINKASIELGGQQFKNSKVFVWDKFPHTRASFDALLGMKFLKDHHAKIDCAKGTLDITV